VRFLIISEVIFYLIGNDSTTLVDTSESSNPSRKTPL